jgi:NAD(P)-dependent dehydrogenase (short-subunit alcohol dehydrogenase family)
VLQVESLDDLNFDTMRQQYECNALGPLRTVKALRDKLAAGGKVAVITSRMGSISDNTSGSYYGEKRGAELLFFFSFLLFFFILLSVSLYAPSSKYVVAHGGRLPLLHIRILKALSHALNALHPSCPPGYRMSKAAVNMAGMSLSRDLKDAGVSVGIIHPGESITIIYLSIYKCRAPRMFPMRNFSWLMYTLRFTLLFFF